MVLMQECEIHLLMVAGVEVAFFCGHLLQQHFLPVKQRFIYILLPYIKNYVRFNFVLSVRSNIDFLSM